MNDFPPRSFLGVLLGFTAMFFLCVWREEKKPPTDTAEMLLQQAQQEMREAQAKNRERAVQAITQKNNLQALADQTQKMVDSLGAKEDKARAEGDAERTSDLLTEREKYLETQAGLEASLQNAIQTTEAVKIAMRREEERIRAKTAEALAMKARHRQFQIELAIEKSRLGLTTTRAGDLFNRAQTKIQQAQARRDLTAQIRRTSELLETAAEDAARRDDENLRRRFLSERDALTQAALNPKLWDE